MADHNKLENRTTLNIPLIQGDTGAPGDELTIVNEANTMGDKGIANPGFILNEATDSEGATKSISQRRGAHLILNIKPCTAIGENNGTGVDMDSGVPQRIERREPIGQQVEPPGSVVGERKILDIPSIDIDEPSQHELSDYDELDDELSQQMSFKIAVPLIGVEVVEHENGDIPTPLPTPLPFQKRDSLKMFLFEADTISMCSRRGSYTMDRVTPKPILRAPRRGSYGQSGDMASLTVPTLKHSCLSDPEEDDDLSLTNYYPGSDGEYTLLCQSETEFTLRNNQPTVVETPLTAVKCDSEVPLLNHAELRSSADQSYDNNGLKPGFPDIGESHEPPPSPGMLSTHSAWSELVRLGNSRRSSDAGQSEYSQRSNSVSISNVSSSLSEHLRNLVRAFSSRTEKIKETTLQPPSPTSLSDFAGSDALSAISAEPQARHRLDSFVPVQPEGDTISEIVRNREEVELEQRQKFKVPKWIRRLKFPHVIEPQSKLYLLWLFIVTLAFMYNAWAIPLRAVFPYQTKENLKYWLACDYVCDGIYIVDILLFKMRISFLSSGLKEIHRKATRANYMKKIMFKFDCLSLLPLDLLYLISMTINPWYRLTRLLKIQTFWEFYSRCDHLVKSAHALRILKTMTYMLFLIHIETCGYYAVSVYEGIGSNRWVYNGEGNAYIRCFYLATKTATSIGNNPIPTNTLEYGFMTAYWVSGVFVFALLIGQIRDIVDAANLVKTIYTQKMDSALNYVKNMNVPKDTQDRVRTWFIYNWQQQKVIDERSLMDALPMKLRKDLAIHVHFNTLSKVKLFQDCDKTLLYDLVLKLKPVLYLPNDYVCRKGEIGKEMYIVSQGIVEVVGGPDNTLVLATLKEGSVFGEISLLAMAAEGNRRTADVRCKGFTNLFILSKNDFESAMKDYPDAHALLKKRAKKLLRMNARIQRKSQSSMEQNKITLEPIIRTPPETPRLVKTVIQCLFDQAYVEIMPPDSNFIKRLKHEKGLETDEDDQGKENEGFEPGSEYSLSTKALPTAEEAEDFYDGMLAARGLRDLDPEEEEIPGDVLGERGEPEGEEVPDVTGSGQKKKISDSSVCSTDSGVQEDTKVTSPTNSSTTRTMSNKDSKESCIELVDINEDLETENAQPTSDGINYTADMFGDIEAKTTPVKDTVNVTPQQNHSTASSYKTDVPFINGDEYAKSFAVGFDIDVGSPEFESLSPKAFALVREKSDIDVATNSPTGNEKGSAFMLIDEIHDSNCEKGNGKTREVVDSKKDHKGVGEQTTAIPVEKKPSPSDNKSAPAQKSAKGKKRPAVPTKNKVGTKPETKKEKTRDKSPYEKSPISNIRHNTNKINPQNSSNKSPSDVSKVNPQSSSSKSPNDASKINPQNSSSKSPNDASNINLQNSSSKSPSDASKINPQNSSSKAPSDASKINPQNSSSKSPSDASKERNRNPSVKSKRKSVPMDKIEIEIDTKQGNDAREAIEMEVRMEDECRNTIHVIEATHTNTTDNTNISSVPEENQITCFAEIHREKTLSPSPSRDGSSAPSCESSNQRQRKISVISIGSVLQHGKETLV